MLFIAIQVCIVEVKVKGHGGLPQRMQLITPEQIVLEASNVVGR